MNCLYLLVFAAYAVGSLEYSPMEGSTDMDDVSEDNGDK